MVLTAPMTVFLVVPFVKFIVVLVALALVVFLPRMALAALRAIIRWGVREFTEARRTSA